MSWIWSRIKDEQNQNVKYLSWLVLINFAQKRELFVVHASMFVQSAIA